jgi:MFS superfamily sulfate permease-like transporter
VLTALTVGSAGTCAPWATWASCPTRCRCSSSGHPADLETLQIILPYSIAVAVVGLLESLMTQNIVDDLTDTKSNRNQECVGQGLANTATGFIGGMAGCAMIGQSIINVKSGGRGGCPVSWRGCSC